MIRIVLYVILFVLSNVCAEAQGALQKAVDAFAKAPMMQSASLSVCVLDAQSGQQLAGFDARKSLIPASSLKTITTASALAMLGSDYRFRTELQYDGKLSADGTLSGNLYIKGYGDPTLGSDQMEDTPDLEAILSSFVQAIQKEGIQRVEGHIVGDASFFESAAAGRRWLWEDLGNYYGSGIWGLNIHENKYYLELQQQSRLGARPEIANMQPEIPNLVLINELRSAEKGSGDNAYIFGAPWGYTRFIRGTIPVGNSLFSIKGSIPDPPFFAAHCLMRRMVKAGIAVDGYATSLLEFLRSGQKETARKTFYTHQSVALSQLIRPTNLRSINLYCDAMLKAIGSREKGEGSSAAGLAAIAAYWQKKGLDVGGFFMDDGSGLSVRNAVSAYHLASVLRLLSEDKVLYEPFKASLPVAAKSGTLKYMFRSTKAAGKLQAKSGGMERVRSYTGYTINSKGKLLCFSIIANNFSGKSSLVRQAMEKLMLAIHNS
ncbi:MAG: D-alanyl-D-alanine carboxypeptidase/D-alanyl-D-alanine-endopeptidase [Bacteroidota bacterium]